MKIVREENKLRLHKLVVVESDILKFDLDWKLRNLVIIIEMWTTQMAGVQNLDANGMGKAS